jgi:hypothetical protein
MHVRPASNSDKAASRCATMCREAAYAPHLYSIAASVQAMRVGGMATLSAAEILSLAAVECYADGKRGVLG